MEMTPELAAALDELAKVREELAISVQAERVWLLRQVEERLDRIEARLARLEQGRGAPSPVRYP
jgi:uncharacterized membrane protein YccC